MSWLLRVCLFVAIAGTAWGQAPPAPGMVVGSSAARNISDFQVQGIDEYLANRDEILKLIGTPAKTPALSAGEATKSAVRPPEGTKPSPAPGGREASDLPAPPSRGPFQAPAVTPTQAILPSADWFSEFAKTAFSTADANNDGQVSSQEWDATYGARPDARYQSDLLTKYTLPFEAKALKDRSDLRTKKFAAYPQNSVYSSAKWDEDGRAAPRPDPIAELRKLAGSLDAGGTGIEQPVGKKELAKKLSDCADCLQADREALVKATREQVLREIAESVKAAKP